MYTCGPTVYRYAHIGNLRTFLLADLLRRALEADGIQVRQVQNITDVGHMVDERFDRGEDRMLVSARLEDRSPAEIAAHYTEAFLADAAAFNLRPAAAYPRASEYVPQMQELVAKLLEGGHAYEVEGNVYFAVESFPGYGRLSGNTLERLRAGHRQEEPDPRKRHHADFALWKAAGPGRLVRWPSPWGDGYPGWHIECSAMSLATLGEHIDVHTGGEDNVFPHHEDEIAQSEAVVGHPVVTTWVHGRHLLTADFKMSKSRGNFLSAPRSTSPGTPWPGPSGPWSGCARAWPPGPRITATPARAPAGTPAPTRHASGRPCTTTSTPRPPWPSCTSWRPTSRWPRRPGSGASRPSTGSSAWTWTPRSAGPCPPGPRP
jgi:cysteinyl-tRNA synthetase